MWIRIRFVKFFTVKNIILKTYDLFLLLMSLVLSDFKKYDDLIILVDFLCATRIHTGSESSQRKWILVDPDTLVEIKLRI